ncbi:hypothetical protein P8629_10310 [Hydrogenovibrio sp. 3SP14C1]|uniref:hypothetical protein n=1 Tax=Hydrogenovibrio sp. 3SP14C1 TaxID=3038774 RepID=UPI0024178027|nr:hypothetical protein [Hydrogenovibrio sp. 3SP14C1]MDG4813401.1 hypothetical protein [Hydrogenovibrio sp. 3SP14C1]
MNQAFADRIAEEFKGITGIEVFQEFMDSGPTHNPTSLQTGMCGVYAFVAGEHCFKVGKAGPKSKARWNSHHYNLDETTPSTMPKSIFKYRGPFKQCFPEGKHREIDELNKENIQQWIKENMSRMEFLIEDQGDGFALNLLEALVQFHLKPLFEGRHV